MDNKEIYELIKVQYETDLETTGHTREEIKKALESLTEEDLENMKNGIYADYCHALEKEEQNPLS
ncbi:MAG: hypothetical protein IJS61_08435 [Firmicutes bacterium]|nr:hypothetical protein [Bacillota bacterium]